MISIGRFLCVTLYASSSSTKHLRIFYLIDLNFSCNDESTCLSCKRIGQQITANQINLLFDIDDSCFTYNYKREILTHFLQEINGKDRKTNIS